jgi:asparagine synthase (glutamine-hydrolysing)
MELRNELEKQGCSFKGTSDTEVILAAIDTWGVYKAASRFIGMFAFALWDQHERRLYLCRDRMGEKPLYYGWLQNTFVFASELKAIIKHPRMERKINPDAVNLYIMNNYIKAPYTIYKDIYKLLPGTILELDYNATCKKNLTTQSYWSLSDVVRRGKENLQLYSEAEAVDHLEKLLMDSVRRQMVSDVPLGAFLSGGIDSSLIVSLMQKNSVIPVRTFTVGFKEKSYNEAEYANAIAARLGTKHTELFVTSQDALNVIPRLPEIYDEPFADPSQIPTYLIAALTRDHVTVSLSGDGSDELFAGYDRYLQLEMLWRRIGFSPIRRQFVGKLISSLPIEAWQNLSVLFDRHITGKERRFGDKLYKLAEIIKAENPDDLYRLIITTWKESEYLLNREKSIITNTIPLELDDYLERAIYLDTVNYLPDDILVKVDRASMAASLETRIPFLDHRIVEFAWQLPLSLKIKEGKGKRLVRKVLDKYIPHELTERPKSGFSVPIADWLRGPLKEWAEDLLNPRLIKEQGVFNPEPIINKWREHATGKRNWHYQLWNVLMFQCWYCYYMDRGGIIK